MREIKTVFKRLQDVCEEYKFDVSKATDMFLDHYHDSFENVKFKDYKTIRQYEDQKEEFALERTIEDILNYNKGD